MTTKRVMNITFAGRRIYIHPVLVILNMFLPTGCSCSSTGPKAMEVFYSDYNPDHPNMNPECVKGGYGIGGFGKPSFSD